MDEPQDRFGTSSWLGNGISKRSFDSAYPYQTYVAIQLPQAFDIFNLLRGDLAHAILGQIYTRNPVSQRILYSYSPVPHSNNKLTSSNVVNHQNTPLFQIRIRVVLIPFQPGTSRSRMPCCRNSLSTKTGGPPPPSAEKAL